VPKILERSVMEVKARADIVEVVGAAITLKRNGNSYAGLCPFHEEKSPSFHVRPGKGYKCFGCGKAGDSLKFVMEREGLDFVGAVEKLAAQFGILLEYEEPARRAAAESSVPSDSEGGEAEEEQANVLTLPPGCDPKAAKRAIARQMRYEAERAKEDRLQETWRKAHAPAVERRPLYGWSQPVREQWAAGDVCMARGLPQTLAEQLANERGWPVDWVHWLAETGLVAWPELPWSGFRSVAFKVEAPVVLEVPDAARPSGVRSALQDLRAVGYHQRFMVKERKSWVYVPYWGDAEKGLNNFQAAIRAAELARARVEGDGLVPALPFVMGARSGLRFLVIAEGQWDAVTFAGAMGWIGEEKVMPEGVMVMGSRGSSGVDTLLAYWGDWIRSEAPAVLVLADNDAAGRKWDTPEPTEPGGLPMPTFAQKLEAAGASRVMVSRVRPELGKDFNDFWRARRPSAAALAKWLDGLGFGNGWAGSG